ncbi:MAG: hypothetical protein ACKOXO_03685 [Cyanobium sp.]
MDEKLKGVHTRRSTSLPSALSSSPQPLDPPLASAPEPELAAAPGDDGASADHAAALASRAAAAPAAAVPAPTATPTPPPATPTPQPTVHDREPIGRDSSEGSPELAIDDAADFGADDEDLAEADGSDDDDGTFVEVAIDASALLDQPLTTALPFQGADIPESVYMLVDKTVELQAQPLAEIPELGRLAPEELGLQALVLYTNPRQAKRQCGRSQRVIKLPDTRVLQRTAPYLIRQGIWRVVIEGSLYSLQES